MLIRLWTPSDLYEANRRFSAVVDVKSSTMSAEVTENIFYMTLLHELKAAFPAVSDDIVRQCISQVST